MSGTVSLEAMGAAVSHVRREYGEYGYSIGLTYGAYGGGGVFAVRSGDGSEFELVADRHGNVYRACDNAECREPGAYRAYVAAGSYCCDRHVS